MNEHFQKYLNERYKVEVAYYDKSAIKNKWLNYSLQIPTIIMAAIVPIVAALELILITVILSATMAILIGIVNFGKFEEKWHNYRSTCEALRKELYFYDAKISDYKEAKDQEFFVEKIESIISSEHAKWLTISIRKKGQNE